MDTGNLVVKHIQVNQAPKQRRRTYRAHGRVRDFSRYPIIPPFNFNFVVLILLRPDGSLLTHPPT